MENKLKYGDVTEEEMAGAEDDSYQNFKDEQTTPFSGMGGEEAEVSTLVSQTNPTEILKNLEYLLRGFNFDYTTGKWLDKKTPLVNDKGINRIMIIIMGTVNNNCILSNLQDKEIKLIAESIGHEITELLRLNYLAYDVALSDLSSVVWLCSRMCFFALKRSFNEGERRFLKTSFRSHEQHIVNPQQKKGRGIFGKIFG